MKKLIAILAIMIVLVGAVFAGTTGDATEGAGNANLKVNVTILGVTPTFALRTNATNASLSAAGGPASVGQTNDAATISAAAAENLANGTAVEVKFDIIQVSDAKMFGSYYFSVEATSLQAKQPNTVNDTDWAAINASSKVFAIQAASAAPAITVSEATHSVATGDNAGFARLVSTTTGENAARASITYLGVLKATAAKPYTIGTFSCTWDGNVTAIPVDYEATVTLKVESN